MALINLLKDISMPKNKAIRLEEFKKRNLSDAVEILTALQYGPRQQNNAAAYSLLALLDLRPESNWLLLIEAVTSAGPVDGKRRKELKELFAGCTAGLVFVTAFKNRRAMQSFLSHIAWESEVWIADDPDHMIHFNGERFLGPYPDFLPK
jgi:hypothetical protein